MPPLLNLAKPVMSHKDTAFSTALRVFVLYFRPMCDCRFIVQNLKKAFGINFLCSQLIQCSGDKQHKALIDNHTAVIALLLWTAGWMLME